MPYRVRGTIASLHYKLPFCSDAVPFEVMYSTAT